MPALFGLLAGSSAASEWKTFLLWRNGEPFGIDDPQFGRDLSFFVFDYPWLRFLLSFMFGLLVLSLLVSVVAHYLYGGIRLQTPGDRTTRAARIQIAVLLGLFVLFKAAAYWLDRYGLAVKEGELIVGLTYTDVNAVLPAKTDPGVHRADLRGAVLPQRVPARLAVAAGRARAHGVSAIIIGGVYPAIVQQFQVRPSEANREAPYIQRNIDSTRASYDIADADVQEYAAETDVTAGQLREDAETIPGIRLQDPSRSVDDVPAAAADPRLLPLPRPARHRPLHHRRREARRRRRRSRGRPRRRAAGTSAIGSTTTPSIRTASASSAPSATPVPVRVSPTSTSATSRRRATSASSSRASTSVSARRRTPSSARPRGREPQELDFPDESGTGQTNSTYEGEGGVPVGSLFNRLLYAVKFQEGNILLSNFVNADSKILYEREPARAHREGRAVADARR